MIEVKNVAKYFSNLRGHRTELFRDINLSIEEDEFVTFFGPNGCGKTTLLNIISGVDSVSEGEIKFSRNSPTISYLFQDYKSSLLPWRTVYENIVIPLVWKGINKRTAYERVLKLIDNFEFKIDLQAYPFTLSGGQAQLVGLLRSLIVSPNILMLDEPFSALDYLNRINLLIKLQEIWMQLDFTALFISHDIEEALFLGDRLVILSQKPTSIVDIVEINLPRPRTIDIFTNPEFVKLKQRVLKCLYPILKET